MGSMARCLERRNYIFGFRKIGEYLAKVADSDAPFQLEFKYLFLGKMIYILIIKEERNVLNTIKRKKAKWLLHILRRNCLLKHVIEGEIEGRIEVTGKRERRCKQLLVDHG
jgi:hypothetical protein